ncbi:MAG: hypothetical protein CVV64_19775 [Candidatus Wallbacteria bacterium HGW-Wallbacteria-1]|uniref:Superinfection immunity protein n=1 Tax=Candidatus Wallbacteria bacterium HGW-Wallbacteria-1 TaxID=2013854 RepID=A0A2N1PIR3_9BACT|nr:MAG: hypothetical protein CVV64_19775 [Candidatus Wallbacteria bacterium HGW-Wallbacteria-1]
MGIGFTEIIVILFGIPFLCLPSLIAIGTNHPRKLSIILVNILGLPIGGLGWVVAMVWCFFRQNENGNRSENEEDSR